MNKRDCGVMLASARHTIRERSLLHLAYDAIDLWACDLDADEETREQCSAALSHDERARAARFRDPNDADRFSVAHGVMRIILARYTRIPCEDLRFDIAAAGKPRLSESLAELPVHFNLSHSASAALLAVAPFEVGADIERFRCDIAVDAIAGRYFYGTEAQCIERAPPADKHSVFLRHWVAKEAVLKGVGLGIGAGLDGFAVEFRNGTATADVVTHAPKVVAPGWRVMLLSGLSGYLAAVAARRDHWQIRTHYPASTCLEV